MAEGSGTTVNTLFNNVLGENEKYIFYFYLKTKETSIWPLTAFPVVKIWLITLFCFYCCLGNLELARLWKSSGCSSFIVLGKFWNSSFFHSTIIFYYFCFFSGPLQLLILLNGNCNCQVSLPSELSLSKLGNWTDSDNFLRYLSLMNSHVCYPKLRNLIDWDKALHHPWPELTKSNSQYLNSGNMNLDSEDSWATCSGSEMRKISWSVQFSSLGPTLCSLPPGFQPCPPRVPFLSISLLAIFEVGIGRCALLWDCRAA